MSSSNSFDTLGLANWVVKQTGKLGLKTPTPIQANCVPEILTGKDVIGAAKTGSGFGDADEIPNRARLNLFRYCVMRENSVDFGIWFPYGHINQAFRSEFPVPSHALTLGDPTYYTLASAKKFGEGRPKVYPSRRRGRSLNYMLGGVHMTHYGYAPYQLVKQVTATENGLRTLNDLQRLSKYLKVGDIARMEVDLAATPKAKMRKMVEVDLTDPEMKGFGRISIDSLLRPD